ncbi:MAG TPA: alpha/beta fold hydrolase [Anaerolineales bacterium]|nr:alpha/beta fold hydrolase [Anaerolineales bacterium]
MESIELNGIRLAYERRGSGTPMVLLHGYPLDHHLWEDVVPLLEDQFDLILPDLRGFGGSSTVDSFYTLEDYASDIAGLLDHLGIQKAAIVGHSMGGYIALAFARVYPERVSGLGLVASQTAADTAERREGRYKAAAEVADKGIASVVETMAPKFTSDAHLQEYARKSMEHQQPAAYIGALKAMAERIDSTSLLASISYPVVIVHGDADALVPIDRAREVKTALPKAHLVEISGAGHMPMMEAKKKTAEALRHLA